MAAVYANLIRKGRKTLAEVPAKLRAEVYSGPELSFTDTITKGWETVAYRVRAHDSHPCLGGLHRRDEKRTQLCF